MAHHIMVQLLETAVDKLADDLHVLAHMLKMDNKSMIITHDYTDLIVRLPIEYKAYVPKKFLSLKVLVEDWDGIEDVGAVMDLDESIDNDIVLLTIEYHGNLVP